MIMQEYSKSWSWEYTVVGVETNGRTQQMLFFIQKSQAFYTAIFFLVLFFSTMLGTKLFNLCLYHARINKAE